MKYIESNSFKSISYKKFKFLNPHEHLFNLSTKSPCIKNYKWNLHVWIIFGWKIYSRYTVNAWIIDHPFYMRVLCLCMKYMHEKTLVQHSSVHGFYLQKKTPIYPRNVENLVLESIFIKYAFHESNLFISIRIMFFIYVLYWNIFETFKFKIKFKLALTILSLIALFSRVLELKASGKLYFYK